ncbi:hypothetical protein GBAR_LOCUS11923 [Geodia barretti]|uniref:Uncharacterized protein n=1 Tax=Geodia barretti TaxID=519541 RepID=A0AA35S0G0_GEOBA|nr:hypothetical protein GBAR_LOCUS11923 [Geodia barretti]
MRRGGRKTNTATATENAINKTCLLEPKGTFGSMYSSLMCCSPLLPLTLLHSNACQKR